jgi:hypothetical protein
MVIPTYQRWGKVSPIKIKKKWRERCGNAKTVGQTMAMGVDLRGFWEILARVECITPEADLEFLKKNVFTVTFTKTPLFKSLRYAR